MPPRTRQPKPADTADTVVIDDPVAQRRAALDALRDAYKHDDEALWAEHRERSAELWVSYQQRQAGRLAEYHAAVEAIREGREH